MDLLILPLKNDQIFFDVDSSYSNEIFYYFYYLKEFQKYETKPIFNTV